MTEGPRPPADQRLAELRRVARRTAELWIAVETARSRRQRERALDELSRQVTFELVPELEA